MRDFKARLGGVTDGSADLVPFAASDAITANNSVLLNYYQPDGLVGSFSFLLIAQNSPQFLDVLFG